MTHPSKATTAQGGPQPPQYVEPAAGRSPARGNPVEPVGGSRDGHPEQACSIEYVIGPNETTEPWCATHLRWSVRYDMCEQIHDDLEISHV